MKIEESCGSSETLDECFAAAAARSCFMAYTPHSAELRSRYMRGYLWLHRCRDSDIHCIISLHFLRVTGVT